MFKTKNKNAIPANTGTAFSNEDLATSSFSKQNTKTRCRSQGGRWIPNEISYEFLVTRVAINPDQKMRLEAPLVAVGADGKPTNRALGWREKTTKYLRLMIDGTNLRGSRVVWALSHGYWPLPSMQVDHIDGDRTNDCPENLRLATFSQNAANRKLNRNNRLGCPGVEELSSGNYRVRIRKNGEDHRLGTFQCFEAARAERCKAERHHFGAFARLAGEKNGS